MIPFLDSTKPLATCACETCDQCSLSEALHCHFSLKDLVHFYLIVLPSFLIGGAAIVQISGWWLVPWLFVIVGYFGFMEIRVMCSHCPHYAEEDTSLKCWANYGALKLWKYRPGPMTFWEKSIFVLGFILVWGYPLVFFLAESLWFLLLVYLITVAGFFMTLRTFLCSQCINFACPLNSVKGEVREAFFACNPRIFQAWKKD
jgi:hypothetical protein